MPVSGGGWVLSSELAVLTRSKSNVLSGEEASRVRKLPLRGAVVARSWVAGWWVVVEVVVVGGRWVRQKKSCVGEVLPVFRTAWSPWRQCGQYYSDYFEEIILRLTSGGNYFEADQRCMGLGGVLHAVQRASIAS